jgi:3-dehydroquinate synthase
LDAYKESPIKRNVFITGFSGSGKTTVGKEAAKLLGWRFVDLDGPAGESEGENLVGAAKGGQQVIATGGSAPVDARNRELMEESGIVVCLEARPETLFDRLRRQKKDERGSLTSRLLEADDPVEEIRSLKAERQPAYALVDWTIHTDRMSPEEAAVDVVRAWESLSGGEPTPFEEDLAAIIRTPAGGCPVWVGWDILDSLGERAREFVRPSAAYVVGDSGAADYPRRALESLRNAGIDAEMLLMEGGELNKSVDGARKVYHWLAEQKAERGHLVVGVGGGVVGDVAGFAAATYVRGMDCVLVPTTLLSQLDASMGGKMAIDLPHGKNLVGSFHQPRFVLSDVSTITSLPPRQRTAGWAEGLKHALIRDEELLSRFERERTAIRSLEPEITTQIVRRSAAVKAAIVSADEKETLGVRDLLNYGHTTAHALESVTGYTALLHPEAVSIGMMGAGHISNQMGMLSDDELERQRTLLESYGLPISYPGMDVGAVTEKMQSDKKVRDGEINWVLLDGLGNGVSRMEVPADVVQNALNYLAR